LGAAAYITKLLKTVFVRFRGAKNKLGASFPQASHGYMTSLEKDLIGYDLLVCMCVCKYHTRINMGSYEMRCPHVLLWFPDVGFTGS